MLKTLVCVVACAIPLAAFAEAPKISNGMVVDDEGMTLYTFDKDKTMPGMSECTGSCSTLWPAALADAYDQPSGDWSFIAAPGGKHQWAYKGQPLYRYSSDKRPGDMQGDGYKHLWHVARP
ncbi:COG4315 family predicted lipoprotein [Trinickia fusca]|uniref:ATP-binding protein n=1 Tax=Trinickia fusca TaxID=2419777 RepID=A0A494X7M0_9BURK|nr:hypothetical protein [Trinickia fusca]RKP44194.1 hypothetical protein D7S89_23625 [Trinickia fusca]